MSSNYPRAYGSPEFGPDRIWGTIFVVLYALMLAVALLIVLGVASFMTMAGTSGTSGPHLAAPIFGAAFATIAAVFVIVVIGLHLLGATRQVVDANDGQQQRNPTEEAHRFRSYFARKSKSEREPESFGGRFMGVRSLRPLLNPKSHSPRNMSS